MADSADRDPDPRRLRMRGAFGWAVLSVLLLGAIVAVTVPVPYVIERPGPVFDTLGDVTIGGEPVPLIEIPDVTTYPTSGSLDMLTVSVSGDRQDPPNWFEIGAAWFDPSQSVVPIDEVYPEGVTPQESDEQGRIDMENSQQEAIAAALVELGYEFAGTVTVLDTQPGLPSDGVLAAGDILLSVNGETFADVTGLRAEIADNGVERPASIVLERDGETRTVQVTPVMAEDGETPVIGVFVGGDYEFPFEVRIQLENVGGPSAGMMFALGIVDKLTPGELNGGLEVAGTGTISGSGEVGAIGGIRQKLWGAERAGADWFLAPASNCAEVAGQVPAGLTVVAVDTLDDAIGALEAIAAGDTASLPACAAN